MLGASAMMIRGCERFVMPRIAVVIFSNTSDPVYRKRYLGAGADDFLDKTHEFEQLAQAVSNASQYADY